MISHRYSANAFSFTTFADPPAHWFPSHYQAILFLIQSIFSLLMKKVNCLNKMIAKIVHLNFKGNSEK